MLSELLLQLALVFTLESAIFICWPSISSTPKIIAELVKPIWGFNPAHVKTLSEQQAYNFIGIIILIMSFALQLINLQIKISYKLLVNTQGLVILISVFSFFIFRVITKKLSLVFEQRTNSILKTQQEEKGKQTNITK